LTATKQDTERYISLGANPELVYQTGNLKFDTANTKPLDEESKLKLFTSLKIKENSLVILGGSTWAPEELALINAYNSLKEEFPKIQLILVPRHAERGSEVESLLKTQNISYLRRSNGYKSNNSDEFPDVILADTTGELAAITQLTDVFFVGKSLPPHKEGQSPIDSAAAGKPIIMGTGMSNFRQISQSLVDSGGGFFVGGPLELKEKIGELLRNQILRQKSGALAKKWFDKNCGATKRTIEILELSTSKPVNVL
jgi:3-deoxy-D-manno-octulosonic-acid transferase